MCRGRQNNSGYVLEDLEGYLGESNRSWAISGRVVRVLGVIGVVGQGQRTTILTAMQLIPRQLLEISRFTNNFASSL
ncbi:hypothetical protein SS50377_28490 [Spironucleus salmonicida]|uniref:Uncharacterized protein n=1 Tax=Spironucleus salmonicida TaxID=348837 RepID=A0A9P8RUB3_9EUKA|nr:hypothetical protein SS50377_28490 [Spironucleus salmonicida]